MTLSHPGCLSFIIKKLSVICDDTVEQSWIYDSWRTTRIRQKIKEVLGWDCTMNDEMLVKIYAVTTDGDFLIMRLR